MTRGASVRAQQQIVDGATHQKCYERKCKCNEDGTMVDATDWMFGGEEVPEAKCGDPMSAVRSETQSDAMPAN